MKNGEMLNEEASYWIRLSGRSRSQPSPLDENILVPSHNKTKKEQATKTSSSAGREQFAESINKYI